jgi:hypothetical protein
VHIVHNNGKEAPLPYDQFTPIVDLPHDSLTVQAARCRRQPQRPPQIVLGPWRGDLNACIGDGGALVMELDSFAELVGAGARYLDRTAAGGA